MYSMFCDNVEFPLPALYSNVSKQNSIYHYVTLCDFTDFYVKSTIHCFLALFD